VEEKNSGCRMEKKNFVNTGNVKKEGQIGRTFFENRRNCDGTLLNTGKRLPKLPCGKVEK